MQECDESTQGQRVFRDESERDASTCQGKIGNGSDDGKKPADALDSLVVSGHNKTSCAFLAKRFVMSE